jgi:hypothetical protein
MLVLETVVATHHLEHPTKPRYYVFRVTTSADPDAVCLERWENGRCVGHQRIAYQAARNRYTFLTLQCGYRPW